MPDDFILERSAVAKDWHARGFSCGMWIDHAGREWSCDPRETEELLMVLTGVIEVDIAGRKIRPHIGEVIHIPPGLSHTIRNVGGTTAKWLYGQPRNAGASLPPVTDPAPYLAPVGSSSLNVHS
jgi:uncharacterized cupin superfamily protein